MNLRLPSGLGWFRALVLVSQVAGATVAGGGRGQDSSPRDWNQAEAATILNLQTNLRRVLIRSLVDIRTKITQFEGFHSVVGEIIQGLRRREVDPFLSFGDGGDAEGEWGAPRLEIMLRNLQGERGCPWDLSLRRRIGDGAPSLTVAGPTREQLQIIKRAGGAFAEAVLMRMGEGSLKLDKELLRGILCNFRFREYSGDLEVFTENVNQMVAEHPLDFSGFDAASAKNPDEILSRILRYVSVNLGSVPEFHYQIDRLLSALSGAANVVRASEATEEDEEWRLLDLTLADDYPPDVVHGKKALRRRLRGGGGRAGDLEGRPPEERLLMLVAGLTPVSREAKVAYPHLKLRLLAGEGKFFRPRASADVAFLLDSFLTAHPEISPTLIQEVNHVFSSSDFDWEEALKNFDYSLYSRPRTLFLDMVQSLLDNSAKLPLCGKIVLGYFLRINRGDASRAFVHPDVDVFVGKTENPYARVLPDVGSSTPRAIDAATFVTPSSLLIESAGEKFSGTSSSFFVSASSQSSLDRLTETSPSSIFPPSTSFLSHSPPTTTSPVIFTETSEVFTSQASSPPSTVTSERLSVTEKPTLPRSTLFSSHLSTASEHSEPPPSTSSTTTTFPDLQLNSTSPSPLGQGRTEALWSLPTDDATLSASADQKPSSAMFLITPTEPEIASSSDDNTPDGL